ncbi:MAG TPA: DUF169 domain-containing protein [Terriglobia bacterium]|nr:DUF169 domain-containing protein [Terriglobia bacterium]
MNLVQTARLLEEGLSLSHPPIGMSFLQEPPTGIQRYSEAVPTACSFWKAAQTSLFYATAEDHYNCPIGAITQGFQPPEEVMHQAMDLIDRMGKIQYFEVGEVPNVPAVEKPHQVVVYGPLKSFEKLSPDVVMMICTPSQAMLFSEATGDVAWRGPGTETHVFGRPACAVIPRALKDSATAVSLGCMGARTFAGIQDHELLVAVPADRLAETRNRLDTVLAANKEMRKYYADRKSQYAAVV